MKLKQIFFLALVKFGNGVAEMRGSINGTTFSRNASGAIARSRTKPTDPQTASQTANRNRFASVSGLWRTLTQVQRNSWINATPSYPYQNKIGETAFYTGQQLYSKMNGNLSSVGATAITSAALPVSVPQITVNDVTASIAAATIVLDAVQPSVPANFSLRVFASAPMSSGRKASSNPVLLITVIPAAGAIDTADLTTSYEAIFGSSWKSLGAAILFKFDMVSTLTGQNGNLVTAKTLVVA